MKSKNSFLPLVGFTIFKHMACALVFLVTTTALLARDEGPTVAYKPYLKLIEGDQPLLTSYVLSITSPSNVPVGANLTITPVLSVGSAPVGVSTATALSFITLSPSSLVFTGPDQTLTTTVTADVPEGTIAGDYVWAIATPGWSAGTLDPSTFINAKVTIPQTPFPPSVAISAPLDGSVYTYVWGGPPLTIPLAFAATAPAVSPITSIDADVSGSAIPLIPTGLGSDAVLAQGTMQLSQSGIFTVRARATNNAGTSADTVEITVNLQAPPPVLNFVAPVATSYTHTPGTTLNVPFSFTATSVQGGINSLTATLNGTPVSLTPGGLGSLNATGSGSLAITAAGSYVLSVTATDPHGTASASRTLTLTAPAAFPPAVSITQPLNGAVFTRVAGSPALNIPFAFTATAAPGATIGSLSGALGGNAVTVNTAGLGSALAQGTGQFQVSAPGSYTFVASAASGGLNGSNSVTFTVQETAPPAPDCTVQWLPPISLGKVQKGGSVLPIKFVLDCNCGPTTGCHRDDDDSCDRELDTSVVIIICEIFANGTTSEPEPFLYSPSGKNSRKDGTYAITGGKYHLNFDTAKGAHLYHVDVYRMPSGSTTPQLLGTKEFTTR